jgi:hypothetical protein
MPVKSNKVEYDTAATHFEIVILSERERPKDLRRNNARSARFLIKPHHHFTFAYNAFVRLKRAANRRIKRGDPLSTSEVTTADPQTPPQLPHHKVKIKKSGQRACNEKNDKGKFCGGHLKRWFYTTDVIERSCGDAEQAWGPDAEVYRCEHCQTLYLPNPADAKMNVAGEGMISVFGLTLPPKDKAGT